MTLSDIVKVKGSTVWTVSEKQEIPEAVGILVRERIGALLVVNDDGKMIGMLSERDIVRGYHENLKEINKSRVGSLMSKTLTVCAPEDDINDVMALMTQKRIRHIPVVKDGKLRGMVSIGDVVKSLLKDSASQIEYLKEFMYGPEVKQIQLKTAR